MIENMVFKVGFYAFLGFLIALNVLSQYDEENGKRNEPNTDQKYRPYQVTYLLPFWYCMEFIEIIIEIIFDTQRSTQMLLSMCFSIFLHIACYYTVLIFLLPLLRKYISARACALLWMIPNFLYILHFDVMKLEAPLFIIPSRGNLVYFLLGIWFIGFVSVLVWKIISHLRFRSYVLQNSVPVADLEVHNLWRKELYNSHLKKPLFELVISPNVSTPMTIGLLHRSMKVVLPQKDYSLEDLALIFRHELIHIGRNDNWSKLFLIFCTAVCWFNPLMWVAMKKSAEDIELSCDETVLIFADDTTKRRYAELILKTAGDDRGFTTCLSSKANSLRYRLKNVMNKRKRYSGAFVVGITSFILSLSCGYVALAYGDTTGKEIIFQNESVDNYELRHVLQKDEDKKYFDHENKIMCTDPEALLSYLEALPLCDITGTYTFARYDYKLAIYLISPEAETCVTLSDSVMQLSIYTGDESEYYNYYLPEGVDWNYLYSLLEDYPVLTVDFTAGTV